jgi:hypothetical protein
VFLYIHDWGTNSENTGENTSEKHSEKIGEKNSEEKGEEKSKDEVIALLACHWSRLGGLRLVDLWMS